MVYAAILAGGKGLRLNSEIPKQLLDLNGRSVLKWSVDAFVKTGIVDSIIIVAERGIIDRVKNDFPMAQYPSISAFINGGVERRDSSFNALNALNFQDDDIILFHDAARPFVSGRIITDLINEISLTGAAGTYIPAVDTVTEINGGTIKFIPDRRNLYYAQTPQGFRYNIIRKAHESSQPGTGSSVTDDVSLVMNLGVDVKMVMGEPVNFKITTDYDYQVASFIAGNLIQ